MDNKANKTMSVNSPAPVNYSMKVNTPYSMDGERMGNQNSHPNWRRGSTNVPLIQNTVFVPQGTPLPLKHEEMYVQLPNPSMFYFSHNQASLNCHGNYSNSRGEVCTTPGQSKFIAEQRGGNKHYPDDSF